MGTGSVRLVWLSRETEEQCAEDPHGWGAAYSLWAVPTHSLPCNDSLSQGLGRALHRARGRGGWNAAAGSETMLSPCILFPVRIMKKDGGWTDRPRISKVGLSFLECSGCSRSTGFYQSRSPFTCTDKLICSNSNTHYNLPVFHKLNY